MTFKSLTFLFTVLLFSSCEKIDPAEIENLNGGKIAIIGHGGAGFQSPYNEFPENSMGSIKRAIEVYNVDGVELDIQLTKDLKLVCYHDNRLETSTNGYGYIYEFNLSDLKTTYFNNDFYTNMLLKETITSLEEVLIYFSSRKIKPQLHLDLRIVFFDGQTYTQQEFINLYTKEIVDLINRYNYNQHTFIASFSKEALKSLSSLDPTIQLMFETNDIKDHLNYLQNDSIYGVVAYNDRISKSEIEFAHRNNIRVVLFNVKSQKSTVEAVNKNPDYIITDNIPKLQQVLF